MPIRPCPVPACALGQTVQATTIFPDLLQLLRQIGGKDEELRQSGAKFLESQNAQKALLARLTGAEAKIATAEAAKKRDQAGLERQVAALTKERDGLKAELGKVAALLEESNARNSKLLTEVQEAYGQIKALSEEKKALAGERDQLQALMQGEDAPGSVKTLASENAKLRKHLEELREQIASMQKKHEQEKALAKQDAAALQKRIEADAKTMADLRGQLEVARGELAIMKQQTRDYQEQMAALSARLEATEKTLSESNAPVVTESEALGENRLLREIVLKMLKQQAGREKAKQQTVVLLEQNGQLSEDLLKNLNQMSDPYQLTPAERALLNAAGMPREVAGSGIQLEMLAPVPPEARAEMPAAAAVPAGNSPSDSPKDKAGLRDELRAFATAAEVCFRDQRFDEAEANYKKILKDEPQNVHSLCNLAVVQMRQGRVDEAINNLKKSLAYEYQNDFAHYLLGNCHLRQGNISDAVTAINEGLKIKPDNAEGHLSLGFIHIRQKKYSAAEKEFLRAVEFNPSCADAHYNLAVLYASSENPRLDLAKQHYRQALQNGATPDSGLDKFLGR